MAVLLSGIAIFAVMAVVAAITWIVDTIRCAEGQPLYIKIIVFVGVLGTIIMTLCFIFDKGV